MRGDVEEVCPPGTDTVDPGIAGTLTHEAIPWGAEEDLGAAVPVDVAGGTNRRAALVPGGDSGKRRQQGSARAGEHLDGTRLDAAVLVPGGSGDDVGKAVVVDVTAAWSAARAVAVRRSMMG